MLVRVGETVLRDFPEEVLVVQQSVIAVLFHRDESPACNERYYFIDGSLFVRVAPSQSLRLIRQETPLFDWGLFTIFNGVFKVAMDV